MTGYERTMGVTFLTPMTEEEFVAWRAQTVKGYAAEKVRAGNWKPENALELAERDTRELLPNGLSTPGHYLFSIREESLPEPVGTIWLAVNAGWGKPIAFIYDLQIAEPYRRRGYATQALALVEDRARELGAETIALHVFGHNTAALALYEKAGFRATNINMVKDLHLPAPAPEAAYHLRRADRAMPSREEMLAVIAGQNHMTLALCKEGEPYLATVSYGFDPAADCFYFHCAPEGKKIDFLRANPIVWGQVMVDDGYLAGKCDHAYRTVQFRGRAEFVADLEEKRSALALMVDQLEPDPAPVKARLLAGERWHKVTLVRVRVLEMSGKRNE